MVTLQNLSTSTAQEVFDHIATHLLTQKARSASGHKCMLVNYEGLRCAVGCLATPEKWEQLAATHPGIDMNSAWDDIAPDLNLLDVHYKLLCALQEVHDGPDGILEEEYVETWLDELKYLAGDFGLSTEVIDSLKS